MTETTVPYPINKYTDKNMLYLRQLLSILAGLSKVFTVKNEDVKFEAENGKLSLKMSKIWTISEFLTTTRFYTLNFVKLLRFCDETQLEKKLMGFSEKFNVKTEKIENSENFKIPIKVTNSVKHLRGLHR